MDAVIEFLRAIGLRVERGDPGTAFLPGVCIRDGGLIYDPETLLSPGDLLHEAGHLAIRPAAERAHAVDEDPLAEVTAIAWSYAAALHVGLPIEQLFHDAGYRGRAAALRQTFGFGGYPGLPGLRAVGLADETYPRMRRWLRD